MNPRHPSPMHVPSEVLERTRASYARCCAAPDFFACFYRNLFQLAPQVEAHFIKTDFNRQHKLLQHAIGLLLSFPTEPATEPTILRRVADRHSRHELDVPPDWYASFVDALVQTVAEHDDQFSETINAAWRQSVKPGIEYMKNRY